jgi:hypothetical protein
MSRDFSAALATVQAPFVIAYQPAGHGRMHAVPTAEARRAAGATPSDDIPAVVALCGATAQLTIRLGAFERDNVHLRLGRCFECAWAVAVACGTLDDELEMLTPTGTDFAVHDRLLHNPLVARHLCEAIIAEAKRADGAVKRDEQQTIRLLADVCAHAPTVLVPLECADGDCEHWDDTSDPSVLRCPPSLGSLACSTCSSTSDDDDLGTIFHHDRTVAAPCDHFVALASSYAVRGASAKAPMP